MPLKIVNKDILTLKVDALVNSTNHNMYGFSGIDKVLHRMVDPDVYGALHMPRQTFNKLINGKVKAPKKSTIAGIALVMKLSLAETEELLASAGLAFAPADKFDRIIKYCIENHIYNLYTVNVQLVNYDQNTFYAG